MSIYQTGRIFNIQKFSLHDGPGIRTVVFFKGCPLRCLWCANPESRSYELREGFAPEFCGRDVTVAELIPELMKDLEFYEESGGGVTLSGGEPLFQPDFALALLAELKGLGVHTALETTGYAESEIFDSVSSGADLILFDLKHHDSVLHRRYTGVDNTLIISNLRRAISSGRRLLIRIPVIPGMNDSLSDAEAFSRLICALGGSELDLLPFHQFGEKKYESLGIPYSMSHISPIHPEELADYKAVFERAGLSVTCR